MILQPFVENAIWHGLMHSEKEENLLEIKIFPVSDELHCIIQDNGIGRARAAALAKSSLIPHVSKGMKITADRINMLNQNHDYDEPVIITDLYDEIGRPSGTRVLLRLKRI